MNGIVAYGSYIPYYRLDRKGIGETLGASAGSGTRSVACYDEDTTSMAVEAARSALRGAPGVAPAAVYFATANPAYLDKTNATAIHAALDLEPGAAAFDMLGSVRSAHGRAPGRPRRGPADPRRAVRRAHRAARAAPTSARAVTPRRPSCAGRTTPVHRSSRRRSRGPPRRPSSSSAGGCRAIGPRASGKSASASTCTCRSPSRR